MAGAKLWMSAVIVQALTLTVRAAKLPDIYWNMTNPIFRIDNTDHIIDVNRGNTEFEYDQVNIVCPKHDKNVPEDETEKYIIYNVSKEEYETCSIRDLSRAKIIAKCNKPHQSMCFTITFRSFTPQPGGLEFKAGNDYYFIAAPEDIREGENHCLTKNMRVQFKVCCKKDGDQQIHRAHPSSSSTTTTTPTPNPDENSVIYPFYPVPPTQKPIRRIHHNRHHPASSEGSTVDYWPQYPIVPSAAAGPPSSVAPHRKHDWPHHKRTQPHKIPERPVSDDTSVFGKINSIERNRFWERAGKKEGLTNAASCLISQSSSLVALLISLVLLTLLR